MVTRALKQLTIPAVPRTAIDEWPVKEAGLPPRIVNACSRHGVRQIGQLRRVPDEKLMRMRSFGNRSLNDVRSFFDLCRQLERGQVRFGSAPVLLRHFLSDNSLSMLMERYALHSKDCSLTPGMTLDAIGRQFGLTRERVRQQLAGIHAELRTRTAQVCLEPLVDWYADYLRTRHGVAGPDDFESVPFRPWLKSLNPCRLLFLLTELQTKIILRGTLFTMLKQDILNDIEKIAVRYLHRYPKPQRLSDVVAEFEEQGWFKKWRGSQPQLVMKVIEHSPLIGATRDDAYFLFPEGAIYLLATLISEFPRPVRHNVLINRFNEEVKPVSRREADYVTDLLTRSSVFIRGRDGTYRLRK